MFSVMSLITCLDMAQKKLPLFINQALSVWEEGVVMFGANQWEDTPVLWESHPFVSSPSFWSPMSLCPHNLPLPLSPLFPSFSDPPINSFWLFYLSITPSLM